MSFTEFLANPPFPSFVQFETDTRCNARCTFCPHPQMTSRPPMRWSMILTIIEQAAPSSLTMCPFLYQEPLLETRLVAILDNIKQFNPSCDTVVYSNMNAMTPRLAREILETGYLDQLVISFYGPTEQVYQQLQPPLDWGRTRQNIRMFMKLRGELKKSKPFVKMHYITMPSLVAHWKPFFNEWIPIVDQVGFVHYDSFHGVKPALDETLYYGPPHVEEMIPCQRLWSQINILSNGDVVPCCLDYAPEQVLGNVKDNTLREIWMDEPYRELRQSHIEGKYPELCRECTVYKYQFTEVWIKHWLQHETCTIKPYQM